MNLFLSRLLGKMWSTEKFDNVLEKSKKDLIRYQQVISTDEFKEMMELKSRHFVTVMVTKNHEWMLKL